VQKNAPTADMKQPPFSSYWISFLTGTLWVQEEAVHIPSPHVTCGFALFPFPFLCSWADRSERPDQSGVPRV
jgi:hypothetical protein